MGHIIGKGRRASETYPEAARAGASGAVVRLGFANSIERVTYSATGEFIRVDRAAGVPLTVPLTGFKPGNIILIEYSFGGRDAISSGPVGFAYDVRATVDVNGGGQKRIVSGLIGEEIFFGDPFQGRLNESSTGWTTFYKPPALDVTSTPIIGLVVSVTGGDGMDSLAGSALLCVTEVDSAFVTQDPDTTLEP